MDKTHYELLGVPPDADLGQIKAAFRRAMRKHHPDMASGSDADPGLAARITVAYEVLSDEGRRAEYNLTLRQTVGSTAQGSTGQGKGRTASSGFTSGSKPGSTVHTDPSKPAFGTPQGDAVPGLAAGAAILMALLVLNYLLPVTGAPALWMLFPMVAGVVAGSKFRWGRAVGLSTWVAIAAVVAVLEVTVPLSPAPGLFVRSMELAGTVTLLTSALTAVRAHQAWVSQVVNAGSLRKHNLFGTSPQNAAGEAVEASVQALFGDAAVRTMQVAEGSFSHVLVRGNRAVFIAGVVTDSGTLFWSGPSLLRQGLAGPLSVTSADFEGFARTAARALPGCDVAVFVPVFSRDGAPIRVDGSNDCGVVAFDGVGLAGRVSDFLSGAQHRVDQAVVAAAFSVLSAAAPTQT